MFAFWIAAAVLSAAAAGLMLARGARAAAVGEDPSLAVHRRQLAEIDELAERGLLAEAEHKAARAEAGRRLLAAMDRTLPPPGGKGRDGGVATEARADPGSAPTGANPDPSGHTPSPGLSPLEGERGRRLAFAAAALTPLVAMALYLFVGQPGMPDAPYAKRLAQWRAADPSMLDAPRMAAVLKAIAAEHPADPEPLKNLALAELASDNPLGAVEALRKAVAIAPQRADLWAGLGEAFVVQAQGQVGDDARTAFGETLRRDPKSETARYHLARGAIAEGRLAEGLAGWRTLLAGMDPADPRRSALAAEIAQTQAAGGLAAPAPDAAMADKIRGMVEGLAARLDGAPDDPEGWVRLVRAYAVLGESGKRDLALARARRLFKDKPQVLQALDQAAEAPR